jgi:hypothetical protein
MAGVKVTDLPSTASAASTDVMYIVDTAINQSKQIEVGDLITSFGLDSDSYLPTAISNSGAVVSISPSSGLYTAIGNIVTCTIQGTASLDFSINSVGTAAISLPFSLATSTAIGALTIEVQNQFTGYVDTGANLKFQSLDTSLSGLSIPFSVIIQYERA